MCHRKCKHFWPSQITKLNIFCEHSTQNMHPAIFGFTKSLAKELGSKNINVNAISPGFIETDITEGLPDAIKQKYMEMIPLAKFGQAEDVAKSVLFLASDDSSYITGEILKINGGLYT